MHKNLKILVIEQHLPEKIKGSYKFTYNLVKILQTITKVWVISENLDDKFLNRKIHLRKVGISPHLLGDISPKFFSIVKLNSKVI